MECQEQGCKDKAVRRGYCNKHHLRLKRAADKGDEKAKQLLGTFKVYLKRTPDDKLPTEAEKPFPPECYATDGIAICNLPSNKKNPEGRCYRAPIDDINRNKGIPSAKYWRRGQLDMKSLHLKKDVASFTDREIPPRIK